MDLRIDQAIAVAALVVSILSLFIWVDVNQKRPLDHAMEVSFSKKRDDSEAAQPGHSARGLRWFRLSLGTAAASGAYLYLTNGV